MADSEHKFQLEQETFDKNLQKWLVERLVGKYVVIKEREIVGIYDNGSKAFASGLKQFGASNFFMSGIIPTDATDVRLFTVAV